MRASTVGLALGCLLLVAGCGGGADDGSGSAMPTADPSSSATSPSGSPPPSTSGGPAHPEPTLTAKPSGRAVQVFGVVRVSAEDRCTVLVPDDGGSAWVLVGGVAEVSDGDSVTVSGRADTGTTSRCQRGPVLVVDSVRTSP